MKVPIKCIMSAVVGLTGAAMFEATAAPASAAIVTQWDFNNLATTTNNNPVPSIGSGTATPLGMTNNYTYSNGVTGSVTSCDITTSNPGSSDPSKTNYWRVRGQSPGNGWNLAAPELSQGAEFDVDTTGHSGIQFEFDWYSTKEGVRDMQPQYTTDGSTWINFGPHQLALPQTWLNQITLNFSGISAVNNDPNFGVRLVSAYDPTLGAYASATLNGDGSSAQYNNSSGNWRFDMVTVLDNLVVTPGATVTWTNGAGTGKWNATDNNWTGGNPSPNKYKDSDNAVFSDISTNSTITVDAGGVAPTTTTISNPANTYTFIGGPINGGLLTKSSTGTAVLAATNGYTGGTNIFGGTLIVDGGDDRLGNATGWVTISGGTLQTNTIGLVSARHVTFDTNGGTFQTNGLNSSTSGHVDFNGAARITGGGNLTITGGVAFGNSGVLTIDAGSAVIDAHTDDQITMSSGGAFNGNLVLSMGSSDPNNPPRVNFDGSVPYTGTGAIQVQTSGITISNSKASSAVAPIQVQVNVVLNSLNADFTKSDVTSPNPLDVANPFITTIGGTRDGSYTTTSVPNNLHISGVISGNSDVNVANKPTGTGSGNLWLDAHNTYTGATMLNTDNFAKLFIGVNDALPTTTDVIFGTGSGNASTGNPFIDLDGNNQQINSLSQGQYAGVFQSFGITNTGAKDSILTVSGATTPYNSFGGVIGDGADSLGATRRISLVKDGSSTLTLSNANTYTGTTTISGGTLELANLYDAFGDVVSTGNLSLATVISIDSNGVFQIKNGSHTVGTIIGSGTVNVLLGDLTADSIVADTLNIGGSGVEHGQPVPEPGAFVMLAMVALALVGLRGKRRGLT